uniref:Titin n=1 Tax=Stegastes partitus TaxID=144197 RepID=A0A3B5B8Q9_9TELE
MCLLHKCCITIRYYGLIVSDSPRSDPPGTPVCIDVTRDSVTLLSQIMTSLTRIGLYPAAVPDAPGTPDATHVTGDSITLCWTRPRTDGGNEIKHYILERREKKSLRWVKVSSKRPITELRHRVINLTEGNEYEFRVMAENGAGVGPALDRLTSPEIDIDANFKQTHIVKNGGIVTLHVAFRGKPTPLATWSRADGELPVMADINTTDSFSTLTIESCTRYEAGKYTLSLENNSGRKSITFTPIIATEEPAPPKRLDVVDTTDSTASLVWLKPEHDGGSRIRGYIVECRAKGTDRWVVSGETKSLKMLVEGLIENTEYDFRVKAKNDAGISESQGTFGSVVIKEPRIEPTADLSSITNQLITCKTSSTFTIDIPISGRPAPKVTWKLEEMKLKETDRVSIKTTKERTTLIYNKSNSCILETKQLLNSFRK